MTTLTNNIPVRLTTIAATALLVTACSSDGDPARVIDVGQYEQARVSGETAIVLDSEAYLSASEVRLDCSDDDADLITFEVDDGVLIINADDADGRCELTLHADDGVVIYFDDDDDARLFIDGNNAVRVGDLHAENIDIEVRGNGTLNGGMLFGDETRIDVSTGSVHLEGVEGDGLTVSVGGQSFFSADWLNVDELEIDARGNGEAHVEDGFADEVWIDARGNSEVDISGVTAEDVTVDAVGNSDVSFYATDVVDIDSRGSARVVNLNN